MQTTRRMTPRSRSALFTTAVAVAAMVTSLVTPQIAQAETPIPAPNGASELTAAASCWEIKQLNPAAPSGVYWLTTPQLGAADQFYCDQDTDGGGWVLIGRGREGWSDTTQGMGTPADVSSVITGTAAFAPKQLSSKVIGGLLNGNAVSSLTDGVRLRRATNIAGTTWQEASFTYASPRNDWAWAFDDKQRVNTWTVDTASGTGGFTSSFGAGTALNRVQTTTAAAQGWKSGFGFGSSTRGSSDPNSYLWTSTANGGYARPFTQVFLRPKLLSSTINTAIPDAGTAQRENAPVAESFAQPTTWGVSGVGAGPNSVEGSNEVSAFAESNGIVYVGGNFLTVQQSRTGAGQVAQSYLAAFDVNTGAWIPSFRPTFDKQVKALAILPDGNVAVGGFFTQVNGQARPALVALNPITGATDPSFNTVLINKLSGGVPFVRALDVQGNWLYVGGNFTHMIGGPSTQEVYTRNAGRISVANGAPEQGWNPEFNGTVISLDASSLGDRVYYAGFFSASASTPAVKGAVITTDTASVIPWNIDFSASANYQQAVKEVGNKVWIAGSEHMLFSYDRATMTELSTNILGDNGGDGQAISTDGTNVYAGCHCFWTQYSGASKWRDIGTNWTQADKIDSAGAWNNATGNYEPEFSPTLTKRNGAGAWALFNDSTGVTWFGGDFTGSLKAGFAQQWSGGFVRFARNDATAPTVPTDLTATAATQGVSLNWSGSTDDRGSVSYQILRNDHVVATTASTSALLPDAPSGTKYFVRAVDPSGNWSASTPAVTAKVVAPGENPVLVAPASVWSYSYSPTDPADGWQATTFDSSSWATGAAPIGWGQADLGTTLTAASPKPLTSYYRKSLNVVDATKVESVALTTRADDGIVVYVNGVEVGRNNIAAGPVTSGTYAISAISATNALANPVTITVPGSAFVTGENVISAEVHSNYRNTPSASFELSALATFGTQPPVVVPPPAPTPLVAAGATWLYSYGADAPAATWAEPSFDASAWTSGAAPLGWGQASLGTTITTTVSPKPLTAYYRNSFTVADPGAIAQVEITTRADDGIVLYLNGVEINRTNIPAGPVTDGTYAISAISASNALANPVVFQIPGSAFVAGTNVFAAEVHSNYRATSSASFELTAVVK